MRGILGSTVEREDTLLEEQHVKAQYYLNHGQTDGAQELLNRLIARKLFSVK